MNLKYWLYRKRWELAPYWVPKAPIHIDIETTSRCQLKCNMCPHSESPKKFPIGDMEWVTLENILREGAKIGVMSCKLQWRGEPTLYNKLPEAINLAKELGYIDIMINTNGNYSPHLNHQLGNLTTCIFSIDSINPYTYKEIRRGGQLGLAIENMKQLKEIYPDMKIVAQMRLQELNKDEAKKYRAFFEGKGFEVRIGHAMQRTEKGGYTLGNLKAVGRKNCLMPWRRLLVDITGNVHVCCCNWFNEPKGNIINIGNINEKSLKDLWEGDLIARIRKELKEETIFDIEPCNHCFSRESYIWEEMK